MSCLSFQPHESPRGRCLILVGREGTEGKREVVREIEHYNLEAILAVGYRVRSHRGTQFRQWATTRLSEYLVKGFTMEAARAKAELEYDRYQALPDSQPRALDGEFERVAKQLQEPVRQSARKPAPRRSRKKVGPGAPDGEDR